MSYVSIESKFANSNRVWTEVNVVKAHEWEDSVSRDMILAKEEKKARSGNYELLDVRELETFKG